MKTFLFPSVFVPWFVMIGSEAALFICIMRSQQQPRYRAFEALVTTMLASSGVNAFAAMVGGPSEYFYAYYAGEILKSVAFVAAVYEQFAILFLPRWILPGKTLEAFLGLVAMSAVTLAALAFYGPQSTPSLILGVARRFLAWENAAAFWSIFFVLQFKSHFGIYFRPRCKSIMYGLLAMSGIGIVESVVLALSTRVGAGIIGHISTTAFMVVLIYWVNIFSGKTDLVLQISTPSVFSKKTPTSCRLTPSNTRLKISGTGE